MHLDQQLKGSLMSRMTNPLKTRNQRECKSLDESRGSVPWSYTVSRKLADEKKGPSVMVNR